MNFKVTGQSVRKFGCNVQGHKTEFSYTLTLQDRAVVLLAAAKQAQISR